MLHFLPSYYIITERFTSATPSSNTYKDLTMVILRVFYFHHIASFQKDLNLPPPPNNTYKGLLMVILYSTLSKIQVVRAAFCKKT